jgi:predicted metalloprotease with PDZ domain
VPVKKVAISKPEQATPRARKGAPAIHYRIEIKNAAAHLFAVTLTIDRPDANGQRVMLPTWIPGSYMIREFSRHIVSIEAASETKAGSKAVTIQKIDKHTWECGACKGALKISYDVYAWDLSVRAAHLDDSHGFFNGTSVFLLAEGFRDAPCTVEIVKPIGVVFKDWRVATSMPRASSSRKKVTASKGPPNLDFGAFICANYDELIDHPVEMGTFTHATFEACGVTHHLAITGRHRADVARMCRDFKAFCEVQIALFEPETKRAPFGEYWFLLMVVADGYGGLEHRASTALIANRDDLPLTKDKGVSAGYKKLLGLSSHEYFHSWNVKRLLPEVFVPYDLSNENYTTQLWFFEGITDYYDDLMLARASLLTPLEYLELEAHTIGNVTAQAGRKRQSVAESSFDAWVKYYRQDENAPNAIVSYYQKGSLVGLGLDLLLRKLSKGAASLDDVMRALWNDYAKQGKGIAEGVIEATAVAIATKHADKSTSKAAGNAVHDYLQHAVYARGDIDLVGLFASVGITLSWRNVGTNKSEEPAQPSLNAKISSDGSGDAKLTQVFDEGAAQRAGLSAGDTIVAIDGLRVNAGNIERRVKTYAVGQQIEVVAFRRDEMLTCRVKLQANSLRTCVLTLSDANAEAKRARERWLGSTKA